MITQIKAFEGGYCRQLLGMIDGRSWRMVRFQAVFFALRHEREGWVLIDTGYGTSFKEATRSFPARFYRWATPATQAGSVKTMLAGAGIDAREISHVIVTHFHADHVGGLAEFPQAKIHFHAEALQTLQRLSPVRQVHGAFLSKLIPDWLPDRANVISPTSFAPTADLPFLLHDLFGDGSIGLVPLPGHAPGQLGVVFNASTGPQLYVADAYWRGCQITRNVEPVGLAMAMQWDANAYRQTVNQLRAVYQHGRYTITACHDDGASAYLNGLGVESAIKP